ncbi:hypothetical protein FPV16_17190 [Methylobacterium sp. W2]|uniref:hypothetical protein n=1 Tax=Methylobacterium sp. W2 TaxID=2598107 RepID=UPI001D0C2D15|nr:hypothetical protein [Methylobacterium sp. W2]MCC0807922.1 hypothetical protein [Methylobacterium sp. W2]
MPLRSTLVFAGLASVTVLANSQGTAEASCLRQVANRSTLTLVVGQGVGPAVTVRPGTSRTIRLDGPAPVEISGYCGGVLRGGVPLGQPVLQRSFAVTAVKDRCFYEVGNGFFERELGPSFFPREDAGAFALNNPRQGDLAIGPSAESCAAIR